MKKRKNGDKELLFSPFQALKKENLINIFGYHLPEKYRKSIYRPNEINEKLPDYLKKQTLDLAVVTSTKATNKRNNFHQAVSELLGNYKTNEIAKMLKKTYSNYAKEDYYPLIGEIFSAIGIEGSFTSWSELKEMGCGS